MLRLVSEPPSASRLAKFADPVHALVIERARGEAEVSGNVALEFTRAEQCAWLEHAARLNLCLMVVSAPDSLELYSTAKDRLGAFRPALEALRARLKSEPHAGKTPTKELSGSAAAERLLSRAAGLLSSRPGEQEPASLVRAAASTASGFETLGSTLGTLCWAAAGVAQRVHEETLFGKPGVELDVCDVDRLAAERIVEEEAARWRLELDELKRSVSPPAEPAPAEFQVEEPGSHIRIRVPHGLAISGK